MAVEIERKFLVEGDGWRQHADEGRPIRQAYIANTDRASVRVRIAGDDSCTLTTKLPRSGMSRFEFEHDISPSEAEALMSLNTGAVVEKTRYRVSSGGNLWEVDVFEGANAGLVVAEIELASEDQQFEKPPWLGPEVTGSERYQNSALARRPFCTWSEPPLSDGAMTEPQGLQPVS